MADGFSNSLAFLLQKIDLNIDSLKIFYALGAIAEPGLQIALIRQVQQTCQARAVLVLYRFSFSDAIRQLRQAACYVQRAM